MFHLKTFALLLIITLLSSTNLWGQNTSSKNDIIEKVMGRHRVVENPLLDDILEADKWAREETGRLNVL